ncbi:MAG TPA: ROK family protein [Prolixibacteraceae bacterium]|nr:ROK family protein [Prolixibacteraceae bacterium]
MSEITIGIDLGGTRIKAVAINQSGDILHQNYQPTNDGDDSIWKNAVLNAVREIQDQIRDQNTVIGISAPGLPNSQNTAIAYMPGRLQGLENFIWSDFLGSKTFVLNDAISAMMAEARFGAAKGRKNVIMLTLGTGVGGAILIEGKPYQGAFNKAGHLGHLVIDSEGEPDVIGIPGSLEDAIGNCTILKRSSGKYNSTLELLQAHRGGDLFASEVWLSSVKKLAIGLASLTNILSPEMIILGGGITEAGSDLFDPLEKFMSNYEWRTGGNRTQIVKAQYGDLAGAVGVACFAREMK